MMKGCICRVPIRLQWYPRASACSRVSFENRVVRGNVGPWRHRGPYHYSTISPWRDKAGEGGALKGVKILDLTRVLAGPFCTQILADYGADVIKVEHPNKGDDTRSWRTAGEEKMWNLADGISCYFAVVNRNKRSVTLDIKHEKGREVLLELVKRADIVIDNFLPGGMEKLGIGYDTLSEVNPSIIHASISGYGASGPYAKRAGYDMIAGAEAGLLHITGEPTGPPTKPGVGLTDMCTGLYMHGAILAALQARQNNTGGRGQKLDASLFETQVSLLINVAMSWLNLGQEARRWGTGHPSIVPYEAFKTKDAYLVLGAVNNRQFGVLCRKLGDEGLAEDERFSTNDARVRNREEMKAILDGLFALKTTKEWLEVFEGSGMPYGPINTMQEVFAHPQTKARRMVQTIDFDAAVEGKLDVIGIPVKFSETPASIRQRPPLLGEHTEEVLREIGISGRAVNELREMKVV